MSASISISRILQSMYNMCEFHRENKQIFVFILIGTPPNRGIANEPVRLEKVVLWNFDFYSKIKCILSM